MHHLKDRGFAPHRGDKVTPEAVYARRRQFLLQAAVGTMSAGMASRQSFAQTTSGPASCGPCPVPRAPSAAR
jgi:hypothetical protein